MIQSAVLCILFPIGRLELRQAVTPRSLIFIYSLAETWLLLPVSNNLCCDVRNLTITTDSIIYNSIAFIIDLTGNSSLRTKASEQSHVNSNPASYSEAPGFESRPENWLSEVNLFVIRTSFVI